MVATNTLMFRRRSTVAAMSILLLLLIGTFLPAARAADEVHVVIWERFHPQGGMWSALLETDTANSLAGSPDTTSGESAAIFRLKRPIVGRTVRSVRIIGLSSWLRPGESVTNMRLRLRTDAPMKTRPIPSRVRRGGLLGGLTRQSSTVSTAAGWQELDIRARHFTAPIMLVIRRISIQKRLIRDPGVIEARKLIPICSHPALRSNICTLMLTLAYA